MASVNGVSEGSHEIWCEQVDRDGAADDGSESDFDERGKACGHEGSVAMGG